jgi:DNA-binding MarR family transcriptional regulator
VKLSPAARSVLAFLAQAPEGSTVVASSSLLAREAGMVRETWSRAVKSLERAELLEVVRGGVCEASSYTLTERARVTAACDGHEAGAVTDHVTDHKQGHKAPRARRASLSQRFPKKEETTTTEEESDDDRDDARDGHTKRSQGLASMLADAHVLIRDLVADNRRLVERLLDGVVYRDVKRLLDGVVYRDVKPAIITERPSWTPTPSPSAGASTPGCGTPTARTDAPPPMRTDSRASAAASSAAHARTTPSPTVDRVGEGPRSPSTELLEILHAIEAEDPTTGRPLPDRVSKFDPVRLEHVISYVIAMDAEGQARTIAGLATKALEGALEIPKQWPKTLPEARAYVVGKGLKIPAWASPFLPAPPQAPKVEEPVDPDPVGSVERSIEIGKEARRLKREGDRRSLKEIILALDAAPPPALQQVPHGEGRRPEPAGETIEAEAVA